MTHHPTEKDLLQHTCGTVGCIGGWTEALFPDVSVAAALGITGEQMSGLCYPVEMAMQERTGRSPYSATNVEAARLLDSIIETGQVDWSKAFA